MLCVLKKKKIYSANVSKHNSNGEKQVILLVISNKQKHEGNIHGRWHYFELKKLSALLRGIKYKHHGNFYCLNCLHSFAKESHKKVVCKNKDICNVIMPSEDTKILEINQYQKSDNASFIIYADL